jgi:hypothetical protein
MVRTTSELVPLLASVLVSAPFLPSSLDGCYAVAGDTLRCGSQLVRVRGAESPPLDTEAGGLAKDRLQRKVMEGRVKIEPYSARGGVVRANVYVSGVHIWQRHIGDPPKVDATACQVLDDRTLKCGREVVILRNIHANGKSPSVVERARQWLEQVMRSGEVKLVRSNRDHYGRVIADLYVENQRIRCGSPRSPRRTC